MKTFIDLFCGIGGFHLALASRGLECVFASDIDERACDVYEDNFGMRPAGDISKIDAKDIPPHDVLCGGFPCQPFSLANTKAKGFEDTRGTLFFEIVRIAAHHKPKLLLLENVPRILSFDKGRVLEKILRTLDDIGYRVDYYKLNSAEYGLATARRRVYFVCIRKDLDLGSSEPPKSKQRDCVMNHLREDLDTSNLERPIEDYVFGKHPNPPQNPQGTKLVGRHKKASRSNRPQGNRVYDAEHAHPTFTCSTGGEAIFIPEKEDKSQPRRLGAHKDSSPNNGNTGSQGRRFYDPSHPAPAFVAGGRNEFANTEGYLLPPGPEQIGTHKKGSMQGYRLYNPYKEAPAMTAQGGGPLANTSGYLVPMKIGGHKKYPDSVGGRIYDPEGPAVSFNASCGGKFGRTGGYKIMGKVRRLHVEEAKTIQGFPRDHRISQGGQGYKQIGNSVIPKMIQVIFDTIKPREAAGLLDDAAVA